MKACLIAFAAATVLLLAIPRATSAGTLPNISGTWYAQGDHSKRCRIEQSGSSVTLWNESGQKGTGTFKDPSTLSTQWNAWSSGFGPTITITGRISNDLQTIHWSNGTFWVAGASAMPTPTPTPNPYRTLKFGTETLMAQPAGHIKVLGGWVAVRRDGHGARACVSFKNEGSVAATAVLFEFPIMDHDGAQVAKLTLDRSGTFSPGIDIMGWQSLEGWQSGSHRGYDENCTSLNVAVAAFPLLSARFATYRILRVEYADGTSWTPSTQP
jgi:hypothetical protein